MEQKTPIPPPPPQIKDAAARRVEMRHFPIFDLGGRGVSIYFVQDCSLRDVEWGGETREGYIPAPRLFSVCYAG